MAKVTVSLPDEFVREVDRHAKAQGCSRAELIREALRAMLVDKGTGRRSWKDAIAPLEELERQWVGQWDSTDVIRDHREACDSREDRR